MAQDTVADMVRRFSEGAPLTEKAPVPRRGPEYIKRGLYGEALFSANMLLASDGELAIAWRLRGEALFGLKRFADALSSFERCALIGGEAAGPGLVEWQVRCLLAQDCRDEAKRRLLERMNEENVEPDEIERLQRLLLSIHNAPR